MAQRKRVRILEQTRQGVCSTDPTLASSCGVSSSTDILENDSTGESSVAVDACGANTCGANTCATSMQVEANSDCITRADLISILAGYIPYIGADRDADLGMFDLTATEFSATNIVTASLHVGTSFFFTAGTPTIGYVLSCASPAGEVQWVDTSWIAGPWTYTSAPNYYLYPDDFTNARVLIGQNSPVTATAVLDILGSVSISGELDIQEGNMVRFYFPTGPAHPPATDFTVRAYVNPYGVGVLAFDPTGTFVAPSEFSKDGWFTGQYKAIKAGMEWTGRFSSGTDSGLGYTPYFTMDPFVNDAKGQTTFYLWGQNVDKDASFAEFYNATPTCVFKIDNEGDVWPRNVDYTWPVASSDGFLRNVAGSLTWDSSATRKYATDIGGIASPGPYAVTHNLNTTDVVVTVVEIATSEEVIADVHHTDVNTVNITFGFIPGSNSYRVIVVG